LEKNGICGPMIKYHQAVSHSEILTVLRNADILYLPLAFESPIPEVIMTASPGKTGEYLSVGRPILVHAPKGSFISWYFSRNGCGVVVDRNDIQQISAGMKKIVEDGGLRRDISTRARMMAERDFSAAEGSRRFLALLRQTGDQ
jgi:glycosyltransferase involved in cell wall biosynthesis